MAGGAERGLHWQGEFTSWDALLQRGRERASLVTPRRVYLVDPTVGTDGFASFFAVATVPETLLLWASPSASLGPMRPLCKGLFELGETSDAMLDRPMWGILTSGSSGTPKVPVGHADTLELVALHYDRAVFQPTFDGAEVGTFATCLPLQFSAAFFMTVLPALFLRRDLLVFPPHDWRALCAVAQREQVICQCVPVIAASGSFSVREPTDMSRAALLLGAGYITQPRIRNIREKFTGVRIANIYGTAETGAISLDREPGHCTHVGFPIPGKPVWLRDENLEGIGAIATTGVDCRCYYWSPGEGLRSADPVVASTDYGHFDDDGRLYLDGRIDAGEKLHGVTIYPRSIERHILKLDAVVDVRVAVVHELSGRDKLVARVIGVSDPAMVKEHCRVLPEIELPAEIECVASDGKEAYTTHGKL